MSDYDSDRELETAKKERKPEKITVYDRLAIHQRTNIDAIRETVPKPQGYLPPRSLPTWATLPIEQRIPLIPAPPGAIYFTRGDLGNPILRRGRDIPYQIEDPLNRERVPSNRYEDLHDPFAALNTYKDITKRLVELEDVSREGEAICTLREFNRYRLYLASLYNNKVREKVAALDELQQFERDTARAFFRQEYLESEEYQQKQERIQKVAEFLKRKEGRRRKRSEVRQAYQNLQVEKLREEQEQKQAEKALANAEVRKIQKQRQKEKLKNEMKFKRETLHKIILRSMTARALRQHEINNKKITRDKRTADWFDEKLLSSAQRLAKEKELQANFNETIEKRGAERQKRVEKFRDELPYRIASSMAEAKRLDNVVRKYALRWLNRVRARLNQRRDESHESLFYQEKKNVLKDCVDNLYLMSGYAKLDDLVLNVLNLKEAIKRQIALEDEEEDEDDGE